MKGQKAAAEKHSINYCRRCLERVEYKEVEMMSRKGIYIGRLPFNLDGTRHECKEGKGK